MEINTSRGEHDLNGNAEIFKIKYTTAQGSENALIIVIIITTIIITTSRIATGKIFERYFYWIKEPSRTNYESQKNMSGLQCIYYTT